jgi:hypothetical protein
MLSRSLKLMAEKGTRARWFDDNSQPAFGRSVVEHTARSSRIVLYLKTPRPL